MKLSIFTAKLLAISMICTLLSACTSIPDIQPFADATANMATALNKGYSQTESQLATLQAENSDLEQQAKDRLETLRKRWKPTKEAINALVAYTDSLAALANAGKTGKQAAQKLTDSFQGLYNSVAQLVPLPGISAGVQSAFHAIAAVNGVIAKMRARKALKEAAEDAAPAVETIARVLGENFAELENISRAAGNAAAEGFSNKHSGLINYQQTLVDNDTRITAILARMNRYYGLPAATRAQAETVRQKNGNGTGAADAATILSKLPIAQQAVLDQIKVLDPGSPANLLASDPNVVQKLEVRQKELLALSKGYRDELARIDSDYKTVTAKLVSIDSATRSGTDLFTKSQEAIKAWAKAHNDLKLALEKKQGITFRELESIVREIAEAFEGGNR
jgi:DNA repair ATPase RecN